MSSSAVPRAQKTIPLLLAESYSWRAGADRIRACLFCVHSDGDEIYFDRRFNYPAVINIVGDCISARAINGPCGIEARYLTIRGE